MASIEELQDQLQGVSDRLQQALGDLEGYYGESGIVDRAAELVLEAFNELESAIGLTEDL